MRDNEYSDAGLDWLAVAVAKKLVICVLVRLAYAQKLWMLVRGYSHRTWRQITVIGRYLSSEITSLGREVVVQELLFGVSSDSTWGSSKTFRANDIVDHLLHLSLDDYMGYGCSSL